MVARDVVVHTLRGVFTQIRFSKLYRRTLQIISLLTQIDLGSIPSTAIYCIWIEDFDGSNPSNLSFFGDSSGMKLLFLFDSQF
jgi:hypothetical protein